MQCHGMLFSDVSTKCECKRSENHQINNKFASDTKLINQALLMESNQASKFQIRIKHKKSPHFFQNELIYLIIHPQTYFIYF